MTRGSNQKKINETHFLRGTHGDMTVEAGKVGAQIALQISLAFDNGDVWMAKSSSACLNYP